MTPSHKTKKIVILDLLCFFFSSRRRHTRFKCDWSSDVCSSDLTRSPRTEPAVGIAVRGDRVAHRLRRAAAHQPLEPAPLQHPAVGGDELLSCVNVWDAHAPSRPPRPPPRLERNARVGPRADPGPLTSRSRLPPA